MNALNHGWGLLFGWVIGVIILVVSLWFIVKEVNKRNGSN
jgi:hypothetical protein